LLLAAVAHADDQLTRGKQLYHERCGACHSLDGLSLAVLQPTGATQSTLYRVNPKTGAATALGAIGPAGTAPLRGFAIRLQ